MPDWSTRSTPAGCWWRPSQATRLASELVRRLCLAKREGDGALGAIATVAERQRRRLASDDRGVQVPAKHRAWEIRTAQPRLEEREHLLGGARVQDELRIARDESHDGNPWDRPLLHHED